MNTTAITITDTQWESIEPYFMKLRKSSQGRSVGCMRQVASAILWVCANGEIWMDIPRTHAPFSTCNAKYRQLQKLKLWDSVLYALARDLKKQAGIDVTKCFVEKKFAFKHSKEVVATHINHTNPAWVNNTLRVFLNPYANAKFKKQAFEIKQKLIVDNNLILAKAG